MVLKSENSYSLEDGITHTSEQNPNIQVKCGMSFTSTHTHLKFLVKALNEVLKGKMKVE